ncbi:MAG: sel1 repeat family protein, partial [Deltaproteobacteria bacterium]|nr:sel1 repeat family protein [Deltaproteobacteria bacterium]
MSNNIVLPPEIQQFMVRKKLQQVKALAAQGSPIHLNELGMMHAFGKGVPKDRAKAIALFEKAASMGFLMALFNHANLLLGEQENPEDEVKAIELFNEAVNKGHLLSMNQLGYFYEHGLHGVQDLGKALEY